MVESILRYDCEILTVDYRLKNKLLRTQNVFLEKSCKNIQNIKSKK
jgi:hypothetical protein